MAKRVELNEMEVEKVVGGSFNFFTRNGNNLCYVDDMNCTYYCTADAFQWVAEQTSDPSVSYEEVVELALAEGKFWK